eukprot:PhF_6_TR22470/c0_g1_i1/m.31862/K16465/CETN1; centrin-1
MADKSKTTGAPTAPPTAPATKKGGAHKAHQNWNMVELTPVHKRELKQSFDLFDTEGTGRIPAVEIKVALRALGFEPDADELAQLLTTVGKDVNSSIDFSEFTLLLCHQMSKPSTKGEAEKCFALFDLGDSKKVSFVDLQRVVKEIGEDLTEEELIEMIDFAAPSRAPKNDREKRDKKDLYVTEEEFMRLLKKAGMY